MALGAREQVAENARADILHAAAICFNDRGYVATSIDDVARSLGATKGMVYHHYRSKADLFADVFRVGMEMNYAAIAPFRAMSGRAAAQWRAMAFAHVLQMIRTKPFQRVVWEGVSMYLRGATTPEQRDVFAELQQSRRDYGNIFRDVIARARDEGDFIFDDPGLTEQIMFLTLNSPLFWYSPRAGETDADREILAEQVVAFAYRGLGGVDTKGVAR
ncbi:MAG: TetR/AcrR family transcriptional regulator [Rhizobiaceae bacterium]|nr:TetR/AcrR family transcriptional regulator [Rhizobiaceae bacterium]MCV0408449.1 TetR/AcrR family transcriptional regulator [Rhizobiaceae bacterium]